MRFDPMRVRCVFALALALCATRAAGQYNILQNPDFSTNLGSWAPVAASGAYWAWDSDGMASGGTAIGLNALAYGPGSIVLRQCVPVSQAVTKHTLHGVVRVASNQGTTGSASMRWRSGLVRSRSPRCSRAPRSASVVPLSTTWWSASPASASGWSRGSPSWGGTS